MYACCVSSRKERGSFPEPKSPPGSAALAMPGSSAARTLLGDRSPSLGRWPNSASLAVSVALLGALFAGPGPSSWLGSYEKFELLFLIGFKYP